MIVEKKPWDFQAYLRPWKEEKFVQGLPEEVYHAEPACSAGQISQILDKDSGIHKLYAEKTGQIIRTTSPAMEFGAKCHKLFELGPEFLKRYRVIPEFTGMTKDGRPSSLSAEARAKKQAWLLDQSPDAIIVDDQSELDQMSGMMMSLSRHQEASKYINGSMRELSVFFNYEDFRFRGRLDSFNEESGVIIDFKTARNARVSAFQKQIVDSSYFIQAWIYLYGCSRVLKRNIKDFKFIAVEKEPPYLVSVHRVGESLLECGDRMTTRALGELRAAIKSGVWLPEPQHEFTAEAPKWLIDKLSAEEGASA